RKVPQSRKLANPSDISVPQNVAVLFSCQPRKEAFEHKKLQHGVFFYCVLKALNGEAVDAKNSKGEVTPYTLAAYVADEVPKTIKELDLPRQQPDSHIKLDQIPV